MRVKNALDALSFRFSTRTVLSVTGLGLLLSGAFLYAGPLNPPAGPVASTYKTLTEIEPRIAVNAANTPGDATSLFKITEPGSYYLTGNITGVANKHGISIAASGVTLDLNGFELVGVPAMGAFDGVSVTASSRTNIAVINGSVRNWGDAGVDLGAFNAANSRVDGVRASGNAGNGISIGTGGTVSNCTASSNSVNGISAGFGCTVSNCTAFQNTDTGIGTNFGGTVLNCTAYANTNTGISINFGGTITNCTAYQNTGRGISTESSCTVTHCTAAQNGGTGISTSFGSTVEGCTVQNNFLDGILCGSSCVIRGNTCHFNGRDDGAGIHAVGNDIRIEGNNCTNADRGIEVDSPGNIIIRNTCSTNTSNWDIVIGNSVGPIVIAGTNTSNIIGNGPVASTLGSTDPHANFSF